MMVLNETDIDKALTSASLPGEPDWLDAFNDMLRIRLFETRVDDLYRRGVMPGLAHLYSGQEAVAVGVCAALRDEDYITSTHRGHGHCLAKGAAPDRMFAELLGRVSGYCRGKGGTMHVADQERSNLGANAIVGGSIGIAAGAALSSQRLGTDRVAVCFFGDGAMGQGLLYEVMNLASLWKLPVIFVCEDNLYSEFTHHNETLVGDLAERAVAFGVRAEKVDGQAVQAVHSAARRAVEFARTGGGPSFLLCSTYRYSGHHVGDIDRHYRTQEEEADWQTNRDCIDLLEAWLLDEGGKSAAEIDAVRQAAIAEIGAAADWALEEPFPLPSEVDQDLYA